ncbi:MAG: alpha/beta hydrolase [Proteobacteria bacterium]|nr:alpha/beta hydrolase [Pseudomonadota bacterium]
MRRLLSPLTAWRMQRQLQQAHETLSDQAIELSRERFALYVPPRAPSQGYALLVFVPPWEDAQVPQQWVPPLDRNGVIFVSAARSGNDADVLDRREPLALLAAYNVMQRYHVDPERIYVGGFSGGSRVALRLALAYPDLFRGALLEAGSDPIGSAGIPLPPAGLMRLFQQDTRLVFLTGSEDTFHTAQDSRSRDSLNAWCVFDSVTESMWRAGHDVATGTDFGRALKALQRSARPETGRLDACRQRNQQAMDAQLQQAQALIEAHEIDAARKLLEQIDAKYGGLAAPRSVELMERIGPNH